jgi:hypothetical protein
VSRGQLADEYIAAIRVLFQSERPEYHGKHIDFSDALFSPRPDVPIPIVLGGSSNAALRRAAVLGDGWHGLRLSPESAGAAITTINQIGHKDGFAVSLRVQTRVGGTVDNVDRAATLHGDAARMVEQVGRYRDAGVQELVIEPFATTLPDFLEQMRLFAQEMSTIEQL